MRNVKLGHTVVNKCSKFVVSMGQKFSFLLTCAKLYIMIILSDSFNNSSENNSVHRKCDSTLFLKICDFELFEDTVIIGSIISFALTSSEVLLLWLLCPLLFMCVR